MGMQINQPRGNQLTRHITHIRHPVTGQVWANRRHLAVNESDIRDGVEVLRRVDDAAAGEKKIVGRHGTPYQIKTERSLR